MLFTVSHLLEGRQSPITVTRLDSTQKALELMMEYEYSQLPVLGVENKPVGIVSSDSILRAITHLRIKAQDLKIDDALVKVKEYKPDDDLFDLLNNLRGSCAALVVNNDHTLIDIFTSYDAAEYFRRRAEDMMFVEDIETTIRDYIRTAFSARSGKVDQQALNTTINEVADKELRQKFHHALQHYENIQGNSKGSSKKEAEDFAFSTHFVRNQAQKSIEELTLSEHIQILKLKSMKKYFDAIFSLDSETSTALLESVRKTRNDLVHFHGEITSKQRQELRYCAEWLNRHQAQPIPEPAYAPTELTQTDLIAPAVLKENSQAFESLPTPFKTLPTGNRYTPLEFYLRKQPTEVNNLEFTFKQIEMIIGGELPDWARKHRSWWSPSLLFPQWGEVGWRISRVNIAEERVVFSRIRA